MKIYWKKDIYFEPSYKLIFLCGFLANEKYVLRFD
jgi:hypothetical protein